jgi:hypothetical protein
MPEGFRYRYDGLYHVARYWQERGKDGFTIWRFRLEKVPAAEDAAPVVDMLSSELMDSELPGGNTAPSRRLSKVTRVVRCSAVGDWVKKLLSRARFAEHVSKRPRDLMRRLAIYSRSVVPTTARMWRRMSSASVPIVTSSLTSSRSGSMTIARLGGGLGRFA